MKLNGATVNFLGDSITEGVGASVEANRYTDVLAREFGLLRANNYGVGGSRIARQTVMTDEPYDRDFCMRMAEMDANADAVVVLGGTNDYGHGDAPLGVPSDRDPFTFWGACHFLMDGLLTRYGSRPIAILTPLHRDNENDPHGDGRKPRSVAPLSAYREILLETARHYALPVLDLYAVSGIQPENARCRELLLPDGLHPSDEGHRVLARKIGLFLRTL